MNRGVGLAKIAEIAAIALMVLLVACRARKEIVTEMESSMAVVDTTRVVVVGGHYVSTAIDSMKTETGRESGSVVEFVAGGGRVSVDSAGNVTLEGVRNISGWEKDSTHRSGGRSETEEKGAVAATVDNGIDVKGVASAKAVEKTDTGRRWYETLFLRLGQGVCIAALMWMLFLYLRRRK